jgi:hypothetical protein
VQACHAYYHNEVLTCLKKCGFRFLFTPKYITNTWLHYLVIVEKEANEFPIYEYMSKGSLDKYVFGELYGKPLDNTHDWG